MRLFNSTLRIKLSVTLLLFLISTPFLAIASDGGNLVKKDLIGFKYIHFGMTEEELENLGINCVVEICHLTESAEQLTILGQRTVEEEHGYDTSVFLTSSLPKKVYEIAAYIDVESNRVTEALTRSLGMPDRRGDRDVWFFKNGAALAVYNPSPDAIYRTRVFYHSPEYAIGLYARHPFKLRQQLNSTDY